MDGDSSEVRDPVRVPGVRRDRTGARRHPSARRHARKLRARPRRRLRATTSRSTLGPAMVKGTSSRRGSRPGCRTSSSGASPWRCSSGASAWPTSRSGCRPRSSSALSTPPRRRSHRPARFGLPAHPRPLRRARMYLRMLRAVRASLMAVFYISTFIDRADKLFKGTATPRMLVDYFWYVTPQYVYYVLPLAVLLATLVTIAVLTRNSELIVMKACGVSLYRHRRADVRLRAGWPAARSTSSIGAWSGRISNVRSGCGSSMNGQAHCPARIRSATAGSQGSSDDIYYFRMYDPARITLVGMTRVRVLARHDAPGQAHLRREARLRRTGRRWPRVSGGSHRDGRAIRRQRSGRKL